MFTWSKLYKSVPYESVVKGLGVDIKGEKPKFCDNESNKQAEEPLRPDEQETGNGR